MGRIILHVDMDAFFASLEADRRGLDGPVVVCVYSGRSEDSGAVSTCSYTARDLGIHAAMPIRQARSIAEDAEEQVFFVPQDKEYYRQISLEIRDDALSSYADAIEQASIDEAYLDVSDVVDDYEEAAELGRGIQQEVGEQFGITCSIGVGPNKLVAKMASDREKPEGLTVVRPGDVEEFVTGLALSDIHGIGEKTIEQLEEVGITSVEQLADADPARLVDRFGETRGIDLRDRARGRDEEPVEENEPKQLSRLTTLGRNSSDPEYIASYLDELADQVHERLSDHDAMFGRVTLLVIDTDLDMHSRSVSLATHVDDREVIREKGEELLEAFLAGFDDRVRRVGLRVADLEVGTGQTSLDAF